MKIAYNADALADAMNYWILLLPYDQLVPICVKRGTLEVIGKRRKVNPSFASNTPETRRFNANLEMPFSHLMAIASVVSEASKFMKFVNIDFEDGTLSLNIKIAYAAKTQIKGV